MSATQTANPTFYYPDDVLFASLLGDCVKGIDANKFIADYQAGIDNYIQDNWFRIQYRVSAWAWSPRVIKSDKQKIRNRVLRKIKMQYGVKTLQKDMVSLIRQTIKVNYGITGKHKFGEFKY